MNNYISLAYVVQLEEQSVLNIFCPFLRSNLFALRFCMLLLLYQVFHIYLSCDCFPVALLGNEWNKGI